MKLRQCDECTECCTMLEIIALKKPKKTRCEFLRAGDTPGCGQHETRPQDCRSFQCAWTQNEFPDLFRPDKLGIMVYYVDSQLGHTMFVTETREGAYDEHPSEKDAIIDLAGLKNIPVMLAKYDGTAIMMVP